MRIPVIVLLAFLPLAAQEIKMPVSLDRLSSKALEVVDVNLDSTLLQLAGKFLPDKGDDAKVKKLISGLKSIHVKSFEFDKTGEYDIADVEAVRSQLRAPGWSRIVGVKSQRKGENAEVYLKTEAGQISGLAVIAADPKELTIVSIVGTITPEQLQDLGGHFGIPRVDKDKKDDE